jgi:hypothetical protein
VILEHMSTLLTDVQAYAAMLRLASPHGNGRAADRMADARKRRLCDEPGV